MAKKQTITSIEMDAVQKMVSADFLNDFNSVDQSHVETRDLRNETEKALNHRSLERHISPSFKAYEQFQTDMDTEVSKVVNDPHLASEQKRAVIKQIAEEKSAQYIQKIETDLKAYREKVSEVKNHLGEMISATEKMTPQQMREFEFVSRDMESETRTSLATAFTLPQVMAVFFKQADLAKHNQAKARFMVKNAHLHIARVAEMASDETEKTRNIREIQAHISRLEQHAYEPHQIGLKKMYENTSLMKRHGLEGKRLIQGHMKKYI